MSKNCRAILTTLVVAGVVYAYGFKDRLYLSISAPAGQVRGALISVTGYYVFGGRQTNSLLVSRVLGQETDVTLRLPARAPWTFDYLRIDFGHPRYRLMSHFLVVNPHWIPQAVTIEPHAWAASASSNLVPPGMETSIEGLEHLRWLNEVYLSEVEPAIAIAQILAARYLLSSLASAGGDRDDGSEQDRQAAIAEFGKLEQTVHKRLLEPCPDDFKVDAAAAPVCGRQKLVVVWPD